MARKSQVVLNCVGPYRFYGEAVVRACVEGRASYVDISGEPQFLERMQLEYHGAAKDSQIWVVGACGFDSIPADMGTVFLEDSFEGQVNSVETFLNIHSEVGFHGHFATWQSAIYGFACAKELGPLRRKLFPQRLPQMKPKMASRALHKNNVVGTWCLPFPGSDRSVVMRSQRHFFDTEKKRPIQMTAYVQCSSLFGAILMVMAAAVFGLMASFGLGRRLLERYPKLFSFGVFSHEGPSRQELDATRFSLTLVGNGWAEKLAEPCDVHDDPPNKRLAVRVSGPEAGYVATPIFMVASALVMLRESDKLPGTGGVYPPGAAFAKTTLIERLTKRGITFEKLP